MPDSISRRERLCARAILLVFLLLVSLPYFVAKLLEPAGFVWGGLLFSADDQNVHLMWARQAQDGAFWMRDLYTTQSLVAPEPARFWNVLPFFIGVFSRFSGLEVAVWYHVFRVALAGFALWQLHRFAFAATRGQKRFALARICVLALAAFTSGAGFLAPLVNSFAPQIAFLDRPDGNILPLVPEAFFSLSAFAFPLNIASFGLLALVWCQILRDEKPLLAFVGALLLANIHTYDAIPLLAAILVGSALQKRVSRVTMAAFFGALLPVLYQILVFRGSEEFRLKALTVTAAPDVFSLILTFSPLILLAIFGAKTLGKSRESVWLLAWIGANVVLLYAAPQILTFSRKMIEGLQLPLLIFAGAGLVFVAQKLAAQRTKWVCAAAILVLSVSPLQFLAWTLSNYTENNASRFGVFMPPLLLTQFEVEALRELDKQPKGAVLCLPFLGSYVPRASGQWTYWGHWAESLNVEKEKMPRTVEFFTGKMAPDAARQFLRANKISYVLETRFEREISGGNSFAQSLGLPLIFSNEETRIFKVNP